MASPVSWTRLKGKLGGGFVRLDHFRTKFNDSVKLALSVYPDARIDVEERGVTLHPSDLPVKPRAVPTKVHTPALALALKALPLD
jgi:hypothetical protein